VMVVKYRMPPTAHVSKGHLRFRSVLPVALTLKAVLETLPPRQKLVVRGRCSRKSALPDVPSYRA
jgi:hypothetical protein